MSVLKLLVPALFFLSLITPGVNAQENKKKGDVYFEVEEMPKFPGGEKALRKYLAQNVKYPEAAKEKEIEGKVYISFVVDADGSVTNASIARGADPILDKEALRVIRSLPKWSPGKEQGEAVKVAYTVPINFALGTGSDCKEKVTNKANGDVYHIVEERPEFPGGDKALRKFIAEQVKYPEYAKEKGIQGKVYVSFVVDTDGSVTSVSIARGVDPALDKESLRVVRALPKWSPGKEKGKAVKVQYTVPINFALKDCKENKS